MFCFAGLTIFALTVELYAAACALLTVVRFELVLEVRDGLTSWRWLWDEVSLFEVGIVVLFLPWPETVFAPLGGLD